ncbi:MAG: GMC family oxidoreductase N-terminal domain-containing protein, partial [Alphaproteobacteria bacterium]|nr:GMC family oxidoreductase N-terminal domain-containing protein [Alphaproteobacteria bacterium]
ITTRGGFRLSSARAFLRPALRRPNLRLETMAQATRILFEGRRARAVEYVRHGEVRTVQVGREIILSAGAINSPQLLQLSGVGPADLLKSRGIELVHESGAVGGWLQDHLCYDHVYRARQRTLNDELYPLSGKLRAALRYMLFRTGPLALSVNQAGGFVRTRPELPRPDLQLYFSPLSYERTPPGTRALMAPDGFSGFCTSVSPCRPTSRGHVAIRSADPLQPPAIQPNFLATDVDVAALSAGARLLRRLAATKALSSVIADELRPGGTAIGDDDLIEDARARSYSVFHPAGTCRMDPEPADSVVDQRLCVRGLTGLRVIDASVFPTVPSGNINAPCMMIGAKGADLILDDAQG